MNVYIYIYIYVFDWLKLKDSATISSWGRRCQATCAVVDDAIWIPSNWGYTIRIL